MSASEKLLLAIRKRGLTQRDFAKLVNDNETVVSRAVRGTWNLDEGRKLRYARALRMKVGDLFGE
jgi:transcriptional regulator with XRE-family HTH domain